MTTDTYSAVQLSLQEAMEGVPFPIVSHGAVGGAPIQTVNARDLHSFLNVGTAFKDWIVRRIEDYGFEEEKDFCSFLSESSGGRPAKEYALTLDMAKELSMVERTEQGKKARQYFIECERRAKADPIVSLNDPATMRSLLLTYSEKVLTLESQVAENAPKAAFYDHYATLDGLYGLQNAARVLNQQPNKFIANLKKKYLFYQGGSLVPYVQYRAMGIFEVKAEVVDDKARYRTFITPKGIQYFAKKMGEH